MRLFEKIRLFDKLRTVQFQFLRSTGLRTIFFLDELFTRKHSFILLKKYKVNITHIVHNLCHYMRIIFVISIERVFNLVFINI